MEEQTLGLLSKTLRRLTGLYNATFKDHGITHNQWMALHYIKTKGGIKQRDLAFFLEVKESSCTALLEKLESENLIKRDIGTKDRRQRLLFLTESGENLLQELDAAALRIEETILESINPREQKQFFDISHKILATIDTLK